MRKVSALLVMIVFGLPAIAEELKPITGGDRYNHNVNDSFFCTTQALVTIGLWEMRDFDDSEPGKVTEWAKLPFGFKISSTDRIEFTDSFPFKLLGHNDPYPAGINRMGNLVFAQSDIVVGRAEGIPSELRLRAIQYDGFRTSVLHAICQKI